MTEAATDRRAKTREIIQHMLDERQQMLVLLCRVSGVEPYHQTMERTDFEEFCQILTDYVASAHFGLYARIAEGTERRRAVIDIAMKHYPRISEITNAVVDFTESYNLPEDAPLPEELSDDLSKLGELMATRVELEDEIIAAMLAPKTTTPA